MTTLPNTDTDIVNQLVTTEFGISSYNAYQVKNTSPFVYGETFEGDTVTEDFLAAQAAEAAPEDPESQEGVVVSPVPVAPAEASTEATLTVPGVVKDVEHDVDAAFHDAERDADRIAKEAEADAEAAAKDAEAEAEKVETEVVDEAEKVPGFAERIYHDIKDVVDPAPAPAPAPVVSPTEAQ